MAFCERLSEQLAVVATIDPQAGATGAQTSDVVDMTFYRRALFVMMRGAGTAGQTVDIQEANGGFTALTATILTRVSADCDVTLEQHLFEVTSEAMAYGCTALRAVVTSSGTDIYALLCLADVIRYHPASDYDLNTVASIQVAN